MESSFRRSSSPPKGFLYKHAERASERGCCEAAAEAVLSAAAEAPSRPSSLSLSPFPPQLPTVGAAAAVGIRPTERGERVAQTTIAACSSSRERESEANWHRRRRRFVARSARQLLGKKVPLFSHSGVEDNTR